jgi:hypothetical protein
MSFEALEMRFETLEMIFEALETDFEALEMDFRHYNQVLRRISTGHGEFGVGSRSAWV